MLKIRIDKIDIEVPEGATILQASEKAGVKIPTMCYKDGLPHYSSCMVCMVRIINKDSFVPSCSALVSEGMEIDASGDAVLEIRKKAVELLLSEHRAECEAPCRVVCPAGYNIPVMNRLLSSGDTDGLYKLIISELEDGINHCVSCKAYCENACRRKKIDEPVSIRNTRIFIAEDLQNRGVIKPGSSQEDGKKQVKRIQRFMSRIGKMEAAEQSEWLKECPGEITRYRTVNDLISAGSEASACMHCDCRALENCRLREISEILSVKDPSGKVVNAPIAKKINNETGLIFENAKCIKCGLCVRVCEDSADEPALCFIHRGFVSIISEPLTADFGETLWSQGEKAVGVCPTGALSFRHKRNRL